MGHMSSIIRYTDSSIEVSMANGNVLKIPVSGNDQSADINISEELSRSGVWKSLEGQGDKKGDVKRSDRIYGEFAFWR